MVSARLLAGLVIILMIGSVWCVDRNRFKRCEHLSFCRRQRSLAPSSEQGARSWSIQRHTAKLEGNSLTFSITELQTQKSYDFTIRRYANNIVRLTMDEHDPIRQRYRAKDSVQEDKLVPEPFTNWDGTKLTLDNFGRVELQEQGKSFKLQFYVGDKLVLSANSKNLLYMEYFRKQENLLPVTESPETIMPVAADTTHSADVDWTGAWEETYSSFRDSKPHGPSSVGMDFTFYSTNVYGIPEHADSLALRHTVGAEPYRLYNLDVFEYELNSEMALYGAVPIMYAHDKQHSVAMLWYNPTETFVDVDKSAQTAFFGAENSVNTHWMSETGVIDVFVMLGPKIKDIFTQYRDLTGGAQLPPLFSIAYHQCRWNYNSEDDVRGVNQGYEDHNIPYDVLWLDIEHTDHKKYFTWDSSKFPTPTKMLENMETYGRKMVTIIDPHIKRDSGFHIHSEATDKGYYVKNSGGTDYDGWCWSGSSGYLDFTSPEVRGWWAENFKYDKYIGSASNLYTWNDMNEPSVFNGPEISMHKDAFHPGANAEHREVHNQYGFYMHMATYDGLLKRNPEQDKRPFVLTRSFFAGSQRYAAVWTGDNMAEWSHLKASVPMLLSLGLGGITFSGADVVGFFREPTPQLATRWYQLGAYYPFFRAHGHIDTKRREPWVFGTPYLDHIREAVRERYRILPYLYTLFYEANQKLTPLMRPLFVEFPEDEKTFAKEESFMLGPSLLIQPVVQENQAQAEVYLPPGVWYTWDKDYKVMAGGETHQVATPLSSIPVFIRGGQMVTTKDRARRSTTQMANDPYSLYVALDAQKEAVGEFYLDDGESFENEKGVFAKRTMNMKNNVLSLQAAADSGKMEAANTLNKVVIIGEERKVKKATLNVAGKITALHFTQEGHVITLRKPDNVFIHDWSISLTF